MWLFKSTNFAKIFLNDVYICSSKWNNFYKYNSYILWIERFER